MSTTLIDNPPTSLRNGSTARNVAVPVSEMPFRTSVSLRPTSIDEYEFLTKAGYYTEDDPFELLEGFLVEKMPRNTPHDAAITALTPILVRVIPANWVVRCQCAARIGNSIPEPDFAICRGPASIYRKLHPIPGDIALVIEVADTSLERDRIDKGRIYARAGIPVYWVVNVIEGVVEVYTDPEVNEVNDGPAYRKMTPYANGSRVPLLLDGQLLAEIAVEEFV